MSYASEPASEEKSSSHLFRLCRIGVVVLLVAAIIWFVDLAAAIELLQQSNWRWLVVALFLVQVQIVLSAWRWQLTAVRLGHCLSVPLAVREYYLATAINMSLPGGVTGDAARAARARHDSSLSLATQGVVLERLAGQIALFFITLVGWALWPLLMDSDVPDIGRSALGIFVFTSICLILVGALLAKLTDNRVSRFLRSFGPAMHRVWVADYQWLVQGLLSILIVASYLVVFAVCSYALNDPLPVAAVFTIVPLVLLSMVLPLSIGGWGVREAAAAALWPLAGLTSASGVASSILYGIVSIVGCLPGLLFIAMERRRQT